jgi:inositol-hexakisphosphate 5-kinase
MTLLQFLYRYIGVLNVTLEKQIRRKTSRKDEEAAIERHDSAHDDIGKQLKEVIADAVAEIPPEQTRIVSQSMKHPSLVPIPTVTFADNRHIIPKSFLQPHPHMMDVEHRSKSDGAATTNAQVGVDQLMPLPVEDDSTSSRPTLTGKHANSWGATMINKKLRYQVFGEAFLQQPIPIHRHKKPASQNRSLPARLGGHSLRISSSESNLQVSQQDNDTSPQAEEESIHRKAMKMAAERNGLTPPANNHLGVPILSKGHANVDNRQGSFDSKTGTSAPEPEIASSPKGKRQRRYSSGGLRRKPAEVADDRGNLKYFEEADDAGYKGDVEEDVFSMDLEGTSLSSKSREQGKETSPMNGHITLDSEIHEQIKSEAVLLANPRQQPTRLVVPRPLNPKEAQTQRESRVEYFLLLEDLTAGMRRPCIMDLKMGTRQYGVYANEKKQASQRRKGATTTSHELGVRVCGLQVWDVRTERYIYLDKYFGRNLHVGREFQDALTRFLYDGVDYSSVLRHIPTILRKLSELEVLIRGLVGYRFYAASLLMVYDGDVQGDDESDSAATERDTSKKYEIDFKMADFANSVAKEGFRPDDLPCPPQHPESPDTGFLRGLRSLKKYFFAIQHELLHKEMGRASKSENGENGTGFFSYDDDGYISL